MTVDIQKYLPVKIYGLTALHKQYLNDYTHRFFVLPPGRRSRKTLLSSRKILIHALNKQDTRYFQGAPTRQQAKAIFWDKLKKNTKMFWAKDPNESDLFVTLINGSEIHVVGLDKPQRIEGQVWHGCHISEFADLKPDAWDMHIRPCLSDTNGFAILDGVPEGKNHLYDMALYACGGAIPKTMPILGAFKECPTDPEWCYYHWFSSDVLPAKEIEAAKRTMDIQAYRQEYEGSFEGFGSYAYYAFSDLNIFKAEEFAPDPELPLLLGFDYNWEPNTAVIAQEVPDWVSSPGAEPKKCLIVFDEIWIAGSTTRKCEEIIERYGDEFEYLIYQDATGDKKTSVAVSDLNLVVRAFRNIKHKVRYRPANPRRLDRMNAVNTKLCNAAGEIFIRISNKCKKLIDDLNKCERDEYLASSFKDKERGHITDCLGYMVEYRYPVLRAKKHSNKALVL